MNRLKIWFRKCHKCDHQIASENYFIIPKELTHRPNDLIVHETCYYT